MPRVPTQVNPISTDIVTAVPSSNIGQAGMVQEAVSRVGAALSSTAAQIGQQVQQEEARDASSNAYIKDQLDGDAYYEGLKLKTDGNGYIKDPDTGQVQSNPDGTYQTMSQAYMEWTDQRFRQRQEEMPTYQAQEFYKAHAKPYFSSQLQVVRGKELEYKVEGYKNNQLSRDQARWDNLTSFGDIQKLYQLTNDSSAEWQSNVGKLFSANQATTQVSKNNQQATESLGKKWVNDIVAIPKTSTGNFTRSKLAGKYIDYLNEDPSRPETLSVDSQVRLSHGLPIMSQMMNPDTKASVLKALDLARKESVKFDLSDLKSKLNNVEADLERTGGANTNFSLLKAQVVQALSVNAMSPSEAQDSLSNLDVALAKHNIPSSIRYLPPNQQVDIYKSAATNSFKNTQKMFANDPTLTASGSISALKIEKELGANANKNLESAKSDWQGYQWDVPYDPRKPDTSSTGVLKASMTKKGASFSNPNTLSGLGPLLQNQLQNSENLHNTWVSSMGPSAPQFRVLTKSQSSEMGDFFKSPIKSDEEKASAIRTIFNEYGSRGDQVIRQMVEDNSLSKDWYMSGLYKDNQTNTHQIVKSLSRSYTGQQSSEILSGHGMKESELDSALSTKFQKFSASISQQSPDDPMTQMKLDAVTRVAKNHALDNIQNNRVKSVSEAVDNAYDTFVSQNWHVREFTVDSGLIPDSMKAIGYVPPFNYIPQNRTYDIVIPRKIQGVSVSESKADSISLWAREAMTPEGLKKLGATPPKGSKFGEEFYNQVFKDDGRAVINSKANAIEVWWYDKNQHLSRPVMQGNKVLRVPLSKVPEYLPTPSGNSPRYIPGEIGH